MSAPPARTGILAALSHPLQRLRQLVTQRVENETRAELSTLYRHIATLQEKISALEVVAADSHAWQPLATPRVGPAAADTPPRFSIVLPTRNRATWLIDAVRSVQAQVFADWELLIVDDGSSDDTAQRLEPYLLDARIRYIHCAAGGPAATRNFGLAQAEGELIAYLDSDNAWLPGYLAGMHAEFDADPALASAYGILLSDAASHADSRLLWQPFDADLLLQGNYIDLNVFVHRRELLQRHRGFDEQLTRLTDWDLILRYTRSDPCRRVPVAGAYYRSNAPERVSAMRSYGDNRFRIARKHRVLPPSPRAPRVLYAIWHYPQLSETYIETEIRAMLRFGVEIEVWSSDDVASPYPPAVRVRRGTLPDAIASFRPDILHVHWLSSAVTYGAIAADAGLPMTARSHGFEVSAETLQQLLGSSALRRLFLYPQQARTLAADPRIGILQAAFDTELFAPAPKDRQLVVRTAAALPSKDLALFFETAKRLPQYRFVLICCTAFKREDYVEELTGIKLALDSPAELYFDLPRDETAAFVAAAAIYLHTAALHEEPNATPIGMPISIAEAMATGAWVLVREQPALVDYVGDAGASYDTADAAARLIAATADWDEAQWRAVQNRAIDRAWLHHADEIALRPVYEEWVRLLQQRLAD